MKIKFPWRKQLLSCHSFILSVSCFLSLSSCTFSMQSSIFTDSLLFWMTRQLPFTILVSTDILPRNNYERMYFNLYNNIYMYVSVCLFGLTVKKYFIYRRLFKPCCSTSWGIKFNLLHSIKLNKFHKPSWKSNFNFEIQLCTVRLLLYFNSHKTRK